MGSGSANAEKKRRMLEDEGLSFDGLGQLEKHHWTRQLDSFVTDCS